MGVIKRRTWILIKLGQLEWKAKIPSDKKKIKKGWKTEWGALGSVRRQVSQVDWETTSNPTEITPGIYIEHVLSKESLSVYFKQAGIWNKRERAEASVGSATQIRLSIRGG